MYFWLYIILNIYIFFDYLIHILHTNCVLTIKLYNIILQLYLSLNNTSMIKNIHTLNYDLKWNANKHSSYKT